MMLRHQGYVGRIELWGLDDSEFDDQTQKLLANYSVTVRWPTVKLSVSDAVAILPTGTRWQWALKPYAVIHSNFDEVIYMDADSFPLRDPSFLFETMQYKQHGAIFWPDFLRMEKDRPIWEMMGVPYRDEPEFETGQMVINKKRCLEPLKLALQMNLEAEKYYQVIWGDKDTFRFAWHKFGQSFAMPPFPIQPLEIPGGPPGIGVMCQHDFEGNRLFQHRNMAKWDLLGKNPKIPGYLLEKESFQFLADLRKQWNGRLNWRKPKKADFSAKEWRERKGLEKELLAGVWLFENQGTQSVCCGTPLPWTAERFPHDWSRDSRVIVVHSGAVETDLSNRADQMVLAAALGQPEKEEDPPDLVMQRRSGLRYMEVTFAVDSTISRNAGKEFYWWDLVKDARRGWCVAISGEDGVTVRLWREVDGQWKGCFSQQKGQKEKAAAARMFRVGREYPALAGKKARSGTHMRRGEALVVANHAYGIGDAVTGVYAAMGAVQAGRDIVYHTRFAAWLARVQEPGLKILIEAPPQGTPDFDEDYAEQLRYAGPKTWWYGQFLGKIATAGNGRRSSGEKWRQAAMPFLPVRPKVDRRPLMQRLDFSKYVLLAPFAAWQARDWPQAAWRRLAWLLGDAGYEVVAIGTKQEEERLTATFNKSNAYWAVDHSPEWVMDAMLLAEAVIGLDSGMVHVAGLLRVPTLCIHTHLPPEFLFNCAPTVKSVTPNTKCVFCRWQGDRGFNEGCEEMCSALATVGPEQVMSELEAMLGKKGRKGERE